MTTIAAMLKRMSEGRSKIERVGNEKGGFVWGEKEMKNKQRSKQRRKKTGEK